jgi:hypothetical protein
MQYSTRPVGSTSQIGPDDAVYNYLKNVLGGPVTKQRYLEFNYPDGIPKGVSEMELIPDDVYPFLE